MSWLSDLTGINLGNIGAPVGAALGSIIPGVGTALGAGLGEAIGGIGSGQGVGKSAAQGAGAYLGTGGAQSLAGMLGGGGDSSIPSTMPGMSYNPDTGAVTGGSSGSGGGGGFLQSIEGALKSAGGSAGSFLSGNGGANALGIAQGVNTALQQQKANNYANQAMSSVQDSYNARAPLRAEGIAGLLHPQTPSLAGLNSITNTGNPFAPKTPGATPGIGATPISAAIPQPQFGTPPTMPAMGALS